LIPPHIWFGRCRTKTPTNLVIINPETHTQKHYTFSSAAHGGGYDDIVFRGCKAYISASNPANNPNTEPAIVSGTLEGHTVEVKPVLLGNASAIDIPIDTAIQLNLQDPDSMTLDPEGSGQPGRPGINHRQQSRIFSTARFVSASAIKLRCARSSDSR
jgi:hypothetical protein